MSRANVAWPAAPGDVRLRVPCPWAPAPIRTRCRRRFAGCILGPIPASVPLSHAHPRLAERAALYVVRPWTGTRDARNHDRDRRRERGGVRRVPSRTKNEHPADARPELTERTLHSWIADLQAQPSRARAKAAHAFHGTMSHEPANADHGELLDALRTRVETALANE